MTADINNILQTTCPYIRGEIMKEFLDAIKQEFIQFLEVRRVRKLNKWRKLVCNTKM